MRIWFVAFVVAGFAVAVEIAKTAAWGKKPFTMPGHGKRPWAKED